MKVIEYLVTQLTDPWVLLGFSAQFMYFLRFVVQWLASEKQKKVVIPPIFWYISMAGSILLFFYSLHQQDIVFISASLLSLIILCANIFIARKEKQLPIE